MHACGLRSSLPPAQATDASRGDSGAALPRATSALDLDAAAAGIARFEAEAAPRIPAEPLSEALEELRLQTPALRPAGCWCTGCAPLPPRAPAQGRPPVLANAGRARAVAEALTRWRAVPAQVLRPVRRDGGGPAAAAVLRLQHRALLLAIVPKGGLARGPQGRMPAPASARRADAAAGVGHAIASEAWGNVGGGQMKTRLSWVGAG